MSYCEKYHGGDRSKLTVKTIETAILEWKHNKREAVKRQYNNSKPGPARAPVLDYIEGPAAKLLAELDSKRKNISSRVKYEA